MLPIIIYGMVFIGSALMICNIITYIRYLRDIIRKGYWQNGNQMLYFPLVLLIMFLVGYLLVGIFGRPDIIMSGILFFGSVYVTIILAVLKGITARVQEKEQLESELRAAEESNRAKTNFLSHMSHEIRTPMNAIIGLNSLTMNDPCLPPQAREQMEKMDASARHMLDLINDILDMSRIESGRAELKQEPFLLETLTDQVNFIIEAQCQDKGLDYDCYADAGLPRAFIGDLMKLRQLLINLLGNAVKFTPRDGRVCLRIEGKEGRQETCPIRFIIQDTGIGIDESFLPHLFDPFSQEDSSNTNRYGGTGLGMSISKSIVDLMDGEIRVESSKNRGTTFIIDLMLPVPDEESTEALYRRRDHDEGEGEETLVTADGKEVSAAAVQLDGLRILFAEDIDINAEILSDLLEMEGMESDWARNGQVAVELFSASDQYTYDAILMDMRMPVMDGLTATRRIRSLDRPDAGSIPIIALTANAFEEDVRQCLEAGMDAHLSKPVDSDLLCMELRRQIGTRMGKPRAAGPKDGTDQMNVFGG